MPISFYQLRGLWETTSLSITERWQLGDNSRGIGLLANCVSNSKPSKPCKWNFQESFEFWFVLKLDWVVYVYNGILSVESKSSEFMVSIVVHEIEMKTLLQVLINNK